MIYFTADNHFSHANIIKYCNRPFDNAEEMDEVLIKNWNNTVTKNDTVYVLGDFCFKSKGRWKEILNRLKYKQIFFIKGNHDKKNIPGDIFGWVKERYLLKVNDDRVKGGIQMIVLDHYPALSWNMSHYGSWQLFGHVHGNLNDKGILKPNQYDVGVDTNDFRPISYEELRIKFKL